MMYRVAVGNRIFGIYPNKAQAIEVAFNVSCVYPDLRCRIVYKNWNDYRGTPVYINGKEI